MKKLLVALTLAFFLVSCDTDPMEEKTNPFVGTWEVDNGVRYIFTETYVTQKSETGETISWKGTYTYDDSYITITTDYREPRLENFELYPNPFIWTYKFEDEWLVIGNTQLVKIVGD